MPSSLFQQLKRAAAAHDVSMSKLVRDAIKQSERLREPSVERR
jgi:hypothetical protein